MRPTSDEEKKKNGTFYANNKLAAQRAAQERVDAAQRSALPVPDEMAEAPSYLTNTEKAEWNSFIKPLIQMGFISFSDIPAAIYYCVVWSEFMDYMKARRSKQKMEKLGPKAKLLGAAAYSDAVRKALNDLGFTPRTRRAVAMVVKPAEAPEKKDDPWSRALGKQMFDAERGQGEFAGAGDNVVKFLERPKTRDA